MPVSLNEKLFLNENDSQSSLLLCRRILKRLSMLQTETAKKGLVMITELFLVLSALLNHNKRDL
jgi:hypothetical protein